MIYRRLLCDFSRRCRDMASMAVRCVGHRLSSHYQSNSSSNLSRCDMSLTFHFFVYSFGVFQYLILACRQLFLPGNLSFSPCQIEHYPTSINTRIKLRFRNFQKKKISAVRADGTLFARLAVVAQSRSLDMRSVLHDELGPVPWSLATPA